MKIYMIRHGETHWNIGKRLQGQSDIALNEFGRELAIKTGEGLRDITFDVVYSSPLSRAYETAQLVLEDSGIDIIKEPKIQEISFGVFEGLCCMGDNSNVPDPKFHYFFSKPEAYVAPEGGEPIREFCQRIGGFLEGMFSDPQLQDKTILLVSHGGAIRAMLSYLKNLPLAQFWEGGVQKNCAVSIVNYNGGKAEIEVEGKVYYDDVVEDYYKV